MLWFKSQTEPPNDNSKMFLFWSPQLHLSAPVWIRADQQQRAAGQAVPEQHIQPSSRGPLAHSPWRGWIGAWNVCGQELVCWQWVEHQSAAPSGWCLELMGQRRNNHLNSLLHYWSARIKGSFKQWYTAFKKWQSTAVSYLLLIYSKFMRSAARAQQGCPTATFPNIPIPSL